MPTIRGINCRQGTFTADEQGHDHLREKHDVAQSQKGAFNDAILVLGDRLIEQVIAQFGEQLRKIGELAEIEIIHGYRLPIVECPND